MTSPKHPTTTATKESYFPSDASSDSTPAHESAFLSELGYAQELKRSFGLIGMVGFAFSIVTSWSALGGVLIVGIESGGPPVMIYAYVGICLATLPVAYSMAEICSAYPVAGGQYSWVAIIAPPAMARGAAWVTGWFMLVGVLAMGAVNSFLGANFVLACVVLTNPEFVIQRWHTVVIAYFLSVFGAVGNIWGRRWLDRISVGMMVWNITSFVVIVVVILACNDHKQPAGFVFKDFQNLTGFGPVYASILGLLQGAFGMVCYDAPAHMTEEMNNASREAPKAIILSVIIGAITGLIFLISVCFCIGDLTTTADSPGGVPLVQIFFDSTGSVPGACLLSSLITVIVVMCSLFMNADGSRTIYAFSRDHGLPFSGVFSKVDKEKRVPVNAILLVLAVQMVLISIYLGTVTGFNTVVGIATEGFYLSYAMPLFVRVLSHFTGHWRELHGPYTLGRYSLPVNMIGLIFLVFTSITFNFPEVNPVTVDNMNYTSAAIGVVGLISAATWVLDGRMHFTGPKAAMARANVAH